MTIEATGSVSEYTPMGSVWATNLPANKSWTFSFETTQDSAIGMDIGNTLNVSASITMDTVEGLSFSGDGIITSIVSSNPQAETSTLSWSGVGTGALGNS